MAIRKILRPEDLSAAALELVAQSGIGGLTLRPLAAKLGTTVSIVSYQFGQKEQILETVIRDAARVEADYFDAWCDRLGESPAISPMLAAQVLEEVVSDLTTSHRARTLLFSELLFNVAEAPASEALQHWIGRRRRFCVYIADHLVPRAAFAMAELMHGLLVDECVYSLALSDIDSYRWLRRLCISRLVGGLVPAGPDAADQRMFDASFEALCRFSGQVELRQSTGERALEDIAQACADLIAESGIAAVTHRAVGQRAAVAASTVAYHFATQPDLVRAGLTRLIPPEQARLEIDGSASFDAASAPRAACRLA